MNFSNRKWASFEEMYDDLKKDVNFKNTLKVNTENSILKLVKDIEFAKNSEDFFNCTCKLSSFFESLDEKSTNEIYTKTNIYVLVLNAALHNNIFIKVLSEIFIKKHKSKLKNSEDLKSNTELVFLNTVLSLAFFGIAINYQIINKTSIEFLRKNVSDLLKNISKQNKQLEGNFVNLCSFLEKIAWDNKLHFNSKFPVKLNDEFLFTNLKTSRSFAGITFTSLIIRPVIENRFKDIISSFSDEKFSISVALDSIYKISCELDGKINAYYKNTPKNISNFFDIFIHSNERNLIFCFKNFCFGFHYQGPGKKFFEIILNKLNTLPILKEKFINYTKNNFKAFNNRVEDSGDEWTNKIFLISIKTISLLETINKAHDSKWIVNVSVREFYQWIVEVHEILNKYYIEDDWDKIKDFIDQENEKIEWKASFYTPLEEQCPDDIAEKLFNTIIKTILAMLNTEGGILLVGLVEKPHKIKKVDINNYLINKNGLTFFDISSEFKRLNKTMDNVRLHILDGLKKITDNTSDKFNNLVKFEPINLRSNERVISIIKIQVEKSPELFFNVKRGTDFKSDGSGGDKIWISLTRRAQGQSIDVDIRKYIK